MATARRWMGKVGGTKCLEVPSAGASPCKALSTGSSVIAFVSPLRLKGPRLCLFVCLFVWPLPTISSLLISSCSLRSIYLTLFPGIDSAL